MKKRMISIVLVIVLLIQIVPFSALAENKTSELATLAEDDAPKIMGQEMVVLGEMTSQRAESEKHFHLNNGNFAAIDYGAPVHYTADGGETWNDIDNTLVLSRDDAELYIAENGDSIRGFASNLRDGRLVTVANGDYSIQMGLASDADNADCEMRNTTSSAEISYPDVKNRGNEELSFAEQVTPAKLRADVLYRNVYDGVDLSYELYSHDIKETILINRPRDNYSFSFKLNTEGLSPELMEDGSIELRNTEGKVIYLIPAPFMFDDTGTESNAVSYSLTKDASDFWTLTILADKDWINDEARVFPVSIDPTIYFAGNSSNEQIFSGYINDNSPNTHPADSANYIRCGNYVNNGSTAGHSIGLIYVNKLPSIPEHCVVTTSMLKLYQVSYSNGNSGYFNYPRLYSSQITDSSFNSNAAESFINSLTWNNFFDKVYYGNGTTLYGRTALDYTKCKITTLEDHYFEITDTTRKWYEGSTEISRLLVLDDGHSIYYNSRASFSGYGHTSFGHQPQLVVLYRNTVGVEGYYDYHSQNIGRAGVASVNNFTLGLSLSVPVYSAPSQALPFGITLTYNSPLSNAIFTSSSSLHTKPYTTSATGYGWKTSVQQTVDRILVTGSDGYNKSRLVYTDADGTEHYFLRIDDLDYEDEDGLGLKITVNNADNPTTFTMTDKEKNTWTFLYGYLSSYVDNNGNALYYAYNGYDYSSGNTYWKPSNANTVYYVTSVWRKNSGVSSATKLVTLNYTNNQLSSIEDMAERSTNFSYDANGNLTQIEYPGAKTASYTYSNATVTDPQTGANKTFHQLTKARDDEAQYEIRYTYNSTVAPRIATIQEYSGAVGSETPRTIMGCSKSNATATTFRYCGADNTLSTDDDIVTNYYFDHWGRSINIVTCDTDESHMLGIGVGAYKQNSDSNKDNNHMTRAASSGFQTVNLLYNSGLEHTTSLYGWTASGNGSASRVASQSSGTTTVTSRTGSYMMQLYLASTSSGKESCYQTVYLTQNETYVFSAYVNTAAVSNLGTGGAYLSFRTSSGTDISTAKSRTLNYQSNTGCDNGWERLEAVFTPTQSGVYQVAVNMSNMAQYFFADDLQLEQVPDTGGIQGEASASSANLIQLGSFGLPSSSGTSTTEVSQFWTFSTGYDENNNPEDTVTIEDDSERGKVICLHNGPARLVRAKQTVMLNSPANRTYFVTAWGKTPVGYTSDGSNLKYNNLTYERFFGIIVKIYYVGYSTPEYQYVAFNCALGGWQYTAGTIVPEEPSRTVEKIELNVTGDLLPNDSYVDDVTLIQEPVQTYTYDANGNLTATTNTEGQTETELDSSDRLKKYTAMNGVVYNLSYEGNSRQPKTIVSDGITTTYTYDSAGNTTNTKVQAPNNGIYMESSAAYNSAKNFQTSTTDTNGNTSSASYNTKKGLLSSATNPNGVTTKYTYNADTDRPTCTYQNGTDKAYLNYQYFSNGRLRQINRRDYLGTDLTRQGYHFNYDAWGNTTSIKVGSVSSNTSGTLSSSITLASYTYNGNGTLARMNYPGGQYVTYEYDKLDRLIEEVYYDSSNNVQADYRYVYNANGQLAKQYAIQNNTVTESYSFEYDSLGRLIRSREESSNNLVQRTEHLYDSASRLTSQKWTIGNKNFSEAYSYRSSDGALNSITAATGDTISFEYDELKRLNSITTRNSNNTAILSKSYSYLNYPGSSTRTTARLGTYTVTGVNNVTFVNNRYDYDANGNITTIEEAYSTGTETAYRPVAEYTYDELNQLKTETRKEYTGASSTPTTTTVVTYVIDTAGNISSVETKVNNVITDTVEYTYGNSYWSDRLTAITVNGTTKSISYASYLNPSSWYNGTDEFTNLTWTQGRRLSSITKGSQTYSYEYDMSGVRSAKVVNGERHEYVTQNGRVVRDYVTYAGTDTFVRCTDFFYDEAGRPFAMRCYYDSTLTGADTFHYVLNAQGDVVQLNYQGGTVYAEYSYDAWGNVTSIKGNSNSGSLYYAERNPLRYRGYYYDTETGFYYLQSRYYDPAVRRFLNADSYGSTGQGFTGFNMFAYCGNNPVSNEDPSGHSFVSALIEKIKKLAAVCADRLTEIYDGMANCYAFAFQLSKDPRTGKAFTEKPQPGEFGGAYYLNTIIKIASAQDGKITSEQVKYSIISGVKADAKQLGFSIEEVDSASFPTVDGQWVVALGFSSYDGDYHWWRRMPGGLWFHKPGDAPVQSLDTSGNLIFDPGKCNRGIYNLFLGYFLVTPNN